MVLVIDFAAVKFQVLHGSLARLMLVRLFLLASAIFFVTLFHMLSGYDLDSYVASNECVVVMDPPNTAPTNSTSGPGSFIFQKQILRPLWAPVDLGRCKEEVNLTVNVVTELVDKQLLDFNANVLCVGEGSALAAVAMQQLGFSTVSGVQKHSVFSLKQRKFAHELDYLDSSFDFVFSRDLDKASVPALLVHAVERILKPGGVGAMLVTATGPNPNSLVSSATPVSSLLRNSSIVHVGHVKDLNLVVFKKKCEYSSSFNQYNLPADCSSFAKTKGPMEPLVEEKPNKFEERIVYLPKFVDISDRKRLVYVDIGAGELLKSNVTNWFPALYPINQRAFNVYFVDYNTSVLLSYVKRPGITFIYHPGLAGNKAAVQPIAGGDIDPPLGEEFNFLGWFKETVAYADFVVLKMNAGTVELKFLSDLFESGAICSVDELFLSCEDRANGEGTKSQDCMDLFNGLRNSGVFVHQWWGE